MPRYAGYRADADELLVALRAGVPGWALNSCLEAAPPENELFVLTAVDGKVGVAIPEDAEKYDALFEILLPRFSAVPVKSDLRAALAHLDCEHDFKLSKGANKTERQTWCGHEADKLRVIWVYLRTRWKRHQKTRSPRLGRLLSLMSSEQLDDAPSETLPCGPCGALVGPEPVSTKASPRWTPSSLNRPVRASTEACGTSSSVGADRVSTEALPLSTAAVGTNEVGSLPCGRTLARHISIASSDGPPENGVPFPEVPPNLEQSLHFAALEAAKGNPPKPFDQHALSKKT